MEPFEIGLTFTGTVSAGAYTAGVTDYIMEALEAWEQAKMKNAKLHGTNYDNWNVPWHEVKITGISGASGGGVTCGLLLNALGDTIMPVREPVDGPVRKNDFYNVWVEKLGIDELTDDQDAESTPIKSMLNSRSISNIADEVLTHARFGNKYARNYIAENLPAIITLTNLRGIPYFLHSEGNAANDIIFNRHADYVTFELSRNNVLKNMDAILIPYDKTLPAFDSGYRQLKDACLATSAFPIAFEARSITQASHVYQSRASRASLAIPSDVMEYDFLSVDGGILNTQPFELLHKIMVHGVATPPEMPMDTIRKLKQSLTEILSDKDSASSNIFKDAAEHAINTLDEYERLNANPHDAKSVKRTIVMIAPLDADMKFDTNDKVKKNALIDVIPEVINAIRNEAMFSSQEIALALSEGVYSRFIIAPVRFDPLRDERVTPSITGTSLNTFGAFLSKDFREHDYFLGRRNAQQFFKRHFAAPVSDLMENPLFEILDFKKNIQKFRKDGFVFTKSDGLDYFTFIPLCGEDVTVPLYNPPWPQGKLDMNDIRGHIESRTGQLIDRLLVDVNMSWMMKLGKFLFLKKIKSMIGNYLMQKIKKNIKEQKLQ